LGASAEAISPELTAASTLVSLLAVVVAGLAWMLSRLAAGWVRTARPTRPAARPGTRLDKRPAARPGKRLDTRGPTQAER
jgi:hypothetical protein